MSGTTGGDRCAVAPLTEGGVPEACAALARSPRLLDDLAATLTEAGLVAARLPAAQLVFLALVSRLHDRPVSIIVKGPSSAGKSWLVKSVLALCPPSAYYALSAMSERALAYSKEPVKHRFLVLYEAEALSGEFASYLVRSLLSEGRIAYETVESGKDGLTPKLIEREGPTGLLSTTTAIALHPENETRLLSLSLDDTPDGQREVFRAWGAEAAGYASATVDYEPWHALGRWLEEGDRAVVVPYAPALAELLPASALRLQRDFIAVLALIKAHALLHRATRGRDGQGRIVAVADDYAAVRPLVEPLIAAGVQATAKPEVRETVEAVRNLLPSHPEGVSQATLRDQLHLDKAVVSRRVRDAINAEYLRNDEDRRGRPSRLKLGDTLRADVAVLPDPEDVAAYPSPQSTAQPRNGEAPS